MTSRERNMVIGLLLVVVLGGGAFGGYTFVYNPLDAANSEIEKLEKELDGTADKQGLRDRVEELQRNAREIAIVKRQSLPPNVDVAKTQYRFLLDRLLQQVGIENFTSPFVDEIASRPPVTPELANKKPAYTRLRFRIEIERTDIWKLADFLYEFYQLDLLHQITDISIVRENKVNETRAGLKVKISIEAIILDGAEAKLALFPVIINNKLTSSGEAIAAIGGGLAVQAVANSTKPDKSQMTLQRKVTAFTNTPILASRPRDYSFLAQNDIFYGVLPNYPLTIEKIADVEIPKGETKIPEVPVLIWGIGSDYATITAKASGTLLPEGPLEFDERTNTIRFPEVSNQLTGYASSTVTVTAHSESTGKEARRSFKVQYNRDPIEKIDISAAIRLVMITGSSEGGVSALIQDASTPMKYDLSIDPKKGITVIKWYLFSAKKQEWRKDREYEQPPGIVYIAEDYASTKRTLKVIAVENDALIVEDLSKPEPKADPKGGKGPRPGGGGFGGGGGGGPPRGGPVKIPTLKSPVSPLAAVAGNVAVAKPLTEATQIVEMAMAFSTGNMPKPPALAAPPVLYRWAIGKSLKDLDKGKLTPDESRKILQALGDNGAEDVPLSAVAK